MLINKDLSDWGGILGPEHSADQRNYINFAGLIAVVNCMIFPFWIVDYSITTAANLFMED